MSPSQFIPSLKNPKRPHSAFPPPTLTATKPGGTVKARCRYKLQPQTSMPSTFAFVDGYEAVAQFPGKSLFLSPQ